MKIENKNILIISPECWDHIFVSKHHYAIRLANKGNKVFFLNPPSARVGLECTEIEDVFSLQYKGFVKGLRFLPSIIQKYFIRRKFELIQALCREKFDIVWSFDNSVFFDFSALPHEVLKISHIVDLNQDFQSEIAAKTADICFCTTEKIKRRLEKFSDRVYKVNHGFNVNNASNSGGSIVPGSNEFKAILVGNLAMPYIDWKILYETVKENEKVDFVFYGPGADNFSMEINNHHGYKEKLSSLKNTFFPGRIPSSEIQRALNKADILLISYKKEHHDDQANPHKMMEYLGSGKTVVSTYTDEYCNKRYLLLMANTNNELCSLLKYAVLNILELNSSERKSERISFALDNTYEKQLERIEKLIAETVFK